MEFFKNKVFNGQIILVPHANPYGFLSKSGTHSLGRFDTVTGENWNRQFFDIYDKEENKIKLENLIKSHEGNHDYIDEFKALNLKLIINELNNPLQLSRGRKLALNLQKLSCESDIMLDLHTVPTATEYVYSASRQMAEINDLKIKNVIEIPNEFSGAMDEAFFISWHHLDNILKKYGKPKINHGRSYTL